MLKPKSRFWNSIPLTPRERRALTIWGPIVLAFALLDTEEREKGTFSEANRCVRRRVGKWATRIGWGAAYLWWMGHIEGD